MNRYRSYNDTALEAKLKCKDESPHLPRLQSKLSGREEKGAGSKLAVVTNDERALLDKPQRSQ